MYGLSTVQVHNTVFLAIITMLYIRFLELTCLMTGSLYPLTNISPIPPPLQPLVTTIRPSVS